MHGKKSDDLELIRGMPKAELHIHIEGAYRWGTIRELHPRGSSFPSSPPWLASHNPFPDFNDFRAVFMDFVKPSTGTRAAIIRHTFEVIEDLDRQRVRYAELNTGPVFHTALGLQVPEVLDALGEAKRAADAAFRIRTVFVMGLNRHDPVEKAGAAFREAVSAAGPAGSGLLSGFDIQGDERLPLPAEFNAMVEEARSLGMRVKGHAGELAGPESVRSMVFDLGVRHVSHGVRAAEDPALMRSLAESGVFLHVCPTSNVMLHAAPSYEAHQLRVLYEAGVKVTINSDDPLLFGSSITDEYIHARTRMGFSMADLRRMAAWAFEASLLPEDEKAGFIGELRGAGTGSPGSGV